MTPAQWQRIQRAAAATAVGQTSRLWRDLESSTDFGAAWSGERAAMIVATSQRAAAARASEYVDTQIDTPGAPEYAVRPEALAGVASDGRPLETLMRLPSATTIRALEAGAPTRQAFAAGRHRLGQLVATQVFDAGRGGTSVAMAADTRVAGWRRELRGATNCSRCVVLAGRFYRWSSGFARHPSCDCVHRPATTSSPDSAGFAPERYFEGLSREQQDATFGAAGAQAIRDGANLGQVVNARRGMRTATSYGRKVLSTTEGTSVRGVAGRRLQSAGVSVDSSVDVARARGNRYRSTRAKRLMPETIYQQAVDREDAIRLLIRHGYI